jgi:hypothetical protein
MVMVNGPFDGRVVTEVSGASFSVSEVVFAGPDFWAGVSGIAVMSFIISSFWRNVGVVPWRDDVSGVMLQAAWHTESSNTNPRIKISRMISDIVFMVVGFLRLI